MNTVVVFLYKRPIYTKRVLDSLARCLGVENWRIVIHVDDYANHRDVLQLAGDFHHPNKVVITSTPGRGCNGSIAYGMYVAFDMHTSPFAVFVEDDIVLAQDALLWFEYASVVAAHPLVHSVSAYNRPDRELPMDVMEARKHFTPWGWGTWLDVYKKTLAPLMQTIPGPEMAWDTWLTTHTTGWEVFPSMARSQNIGAEGGTYMVYGKKWHDENQFNAIWAGMKDEVVGNWKWGPGRPSELQ